MKKAVYIFIFCFALSPTFFGQNKEMESQVIEKIDVVDDDLHEVKAKEAASRLNDEAELDLRNREKQISDSESESLDNKSNQLKNLRFEALKKEDVESQKLIEQDSIKMMKILEEVVPDSPIIDQD